MPEGHILHREARLQSERFAGRPVRTSSPQGRFAAGATRLDGQLLESIDAYGKHLFYRFTSGDVLHIHLGLYGRFRVEPLAVATAPSPNARLVMATNTDQLHLTGPSACDVLTPDEAAAVVERLGPDPILRPVDGARRLAANLRRRSIPIGQALLDQRVVAGIGNLYRAEILFLTGIDPRISSKRVDAATAERIWSESVDQLTDGERIGRIVTVTAHDAGTRTRSEHDRLPREESFYVYQRDGQPCRRCGTPIATVELGGRRTWWCPTCQPS